MRFEIFCLWRVICCNCSSPDHRTSDMFTLSNLLISTDNRLYNPKCIAFQFDDSVLLSILCLCLPPWYLEISCFLPAVSGTSLWVPLACALSWAYWCGSPDNWSQHTRRQPFRKYFLNFSRQWILVKKHPNRFEGVASVSDVLNYYIDDIITKKYH